MADPDPTPGESEHVPHLDEIDERGSQLDERGPQVEPHVPHETKAPPVDPRPRPAYGEYAPEGWEWKPPATTSPVEAAGSAAGGSAIAGPPSSGNGAPGALPGVPHNLGAGAALPGRSRPSQQSNGEPYRAKPPAQPGSTPAPLVPPPATGPQAPESRAPGSLTPPPPSSAPPAPFSPAPVSPARREVETRVVRPADRIVTILLLVAGALGAVQSSFGLMSLGRTLSLIGDVPDLGTFPVPGWIGVMGQVAGLALLAFYAVTLVYSLRRLRTGKLTFWVPLVAGAIAAVLFVIVITVAMFSIPGVGDLLNDPEKATKFLEHLQNIQF